VPGKNTADLAGHPLLAWSVAGGLAAQAVDRVLVTTDSEEIAELGRAHGAEAPFLRPAELSGDQAPDAAYVNHALEWLTREEGADVELVLQLRPTTPLRDPAEVDRAVEAIRSRPDATGLRSVHQLSEPPQKMLGLEDGWLGGLFPQEERAEYWNLPRQAFPPAYWPNGYVDIVRPEVCAAGDALYGARVLGHVTEPTVEVDGPDELDYLRYVVDRRGHPLLNQLRGT
jgi:CMP-N-acetylneuraminic acid synthetase